MSLPNYYDIWLMTNLDRQDFVPDIDLNLAKFGILVHIHVRADQIQSGRKAADSVLRQLRPNDSLYLSGEGAALGSELRIRPGVELFICPLDSRTAALNHISKVSQKSHLLPLSAEALLNPGALSIFSAAIYASSEASIFYADQDEHDDNGARSNPWLKPDWDEDLFISQDYMSAACLIPIAALVDLTGLVEDRGETTTYTILARLTLTGKKMPVRHVPFVAVSTNVGSWQQTSHDRAGFLQSLLSEQIGRGIIEVAPSSFGTVSLHRTIPTPQPKVSIIIPTRDRVDLLGVVVKGVLLGTNYDDFELIIIDNNSAERETISFLSSAASDSRVRVIGWHHPYNYSAINNYAVSVARGAYVCLLNNDTEIIDSMWLREMIAQATRPEVGAVGACLLYPDRTLQHAGVVVGMGGAAGHAHRGRSPSEAGYFAQALVTRGATAVTAACLAISKDKFNTVGGLDADNLAVAYNDVDLCLKLRAKGYRNIYEPRAILIHHESKSRGKDHAPENIDRYTKELKFFQDRWNTLEFVDPMHSAGLDRGSEVYRLGFSSSFPV